MSNPNGTDHVVYLISRLASEANRRLIRVLSLDSAFSPVVVQEDHSRKLQNCEHITIRRNLRPGRILQALGFRALGNRIDSRLYFPSVSIQFARRAASALSSRIERDLDAQRRVTVLTFVPPHDVLETGRLLKQRFPTIEWVVDCQIVWALDEHHQHSTKPRFLRRMRDFEGAALRLADAVVVESVPVKEEAHRLYNVPHERLHAIENAYDDDDVRAARPRRGGAHASKAEKRSLRLGFLGSCFKPPKVPGDKLLHALDRVVRGGVDLRLRIVGDKFLDRNPDHVQGYPWVDIHPRCGHSQALTCLADSDALLLCVARTPWTVVLMHAKLPYYLASGIPIIAIVPTDSNTAALVQQTGSGIVIDCDSDWGSQLHAVLWNWESERNRLNRQPEQISRFSWNTVSRKWLACLRGD